MGATRFFCIGHADEQPGLGMLVVEHPVETSASALASSFGPRSDSFAKSVSSVRIFSTMCRMVSPDESHLRVPRIVPAAAVLVAVVCPADRADGSEHADDVDALGPRVALSPRRDGPPVCAWRGSCRPATTGGCGRRRPCRWQASCGFRRFSPEPRTGCSRVHPVFRPCGAV